MSSWWERTRRWLDAKIKNPRDDPNGNPESLLKADLGLPSDGHILAFGHFTSERNLDVVVLGESRSRLNVYLWNRSTLNWVNLSYHLCRIW
jgi:hypothetical protein